MNHLNNSVRLIGRLGKDPELRTLESGRTVCSFSLATSHKYKNSQGQLVENTDWHNCVAWGKLAELVIGKYCQKGSQVAIEGRLTSRSWENSEGEKKYITEVIVNDVLLLGGARDQNSAPPPADEPLVQQPPVSNSGDDDLPF